ncbi:MAG: hypothetical protein ABW217_10760 [Polyangiaceae bacterium]
MSTRARRLAPLVAAWLAACSADAPRALTPGASAVEDVTARSSVQRFLPLKHDTIYSYDVYAPDQAAPEQLILQVERHSAERANLRSGNVVRRVVFEPEGVKLVTGGYLLRAPLELGANWAGPAGSVRVSDVDQVITVPAGTFSGCIETSETAGGGALRRVIVTSYCPDVGIVRFSVQSAEEQQRFELKSFGPRVDIDEL